MRFNQVLMHTKLENLCQAHVSQGKAIASRHQKTICSMYLASFSDLLFPAPPTPSRADVDSKKKIDVSAFALCNPMSSATKRSHTKVNYFRDQDCSLWSQVPWFQILAPFFTSGFSSPLSLTFPHLYLPQEVNEMIKMLNVQHMISSS